MLNMVNRGTVNYNCDFEWPSDADHIRLIGGDRVYRTDTAGADHIFFASKVNLTDFAMYEQIRDCRGNVRTDFTGEVFFFDDKGIEYLNV